MSVSVSGFAFRGGAEQGGYVVVALYVSLLCEVKVASVGLRLASEGGLEVFFGLGTFQRHDNTPVELNNCVASNASISQLDY